MSSVVRMECEADDRLKVTAGGGGSLGARSDITETESRFKDNVPPSGSQACGKALEAVLCQAPPDHGQRSEVRVRVRGEGEC